MSPAEPRYALISPVRNEAQTVSKTLTSVAAQTLRPVRWVILDDGSSDSTPAIVEEFASRHDFIRVVRLEDRGFRQPGPGVVRVFNRGLAELADAQWDFVGKLDGDVQVPGDYYQSLLAAFSEDPRLGIVSGACYSPAGKALRLEKDAPFHTRGPCKVYRRECLLEIGGLVETLGWDGLDGYMARMKGWRTRTLPRLKVTHFRPTHRAEGILRGSLRAGQGAYCMHYRTEYLLARAALNLFRPPFLIGGLGMVLGFIGAHLGRKDRVSDPELIRFIRSEQRRRLKRLMLGEKE